MSSNERKICRYAAALPFIDRIVNLPSLDVSTSSASKGWDSTVPVVAATIGFTSARANDLKFHLTGDEPAERLEVAACSCGIGFTPQTLDGRPVCQRALGR